MRARHVALEDGREALLRPLVPEDAAELVAAFEGLSLESRRARFLSPLRHLPAPLLDDLTHPDQANHLALVLTVPDPTHPGGQAGLGVARCVRDSRDPGLAEFACTVIDREQGHHLGTLLMTALSHEAQLVGIDRFEALMWADNAAMKHVMDHLGEEIDRRFEGAGVLRVVWRLHPR